MRLSRRPKVVLREPTVDDSLAIAQVLVDSWDAAYRDLLPETLLVGLSVATRASQLRSALSSPTPRGAVRLLADQGGEVIAVVNAGGVLPGEAAGADHDSAGSAEVAILYVSPDHWRQGVGRRMLRLTLRSLAEAGFSDAHAWVVEGNEAGFAFFESQRWTRAGARRSDVIDGYVVRQARVDFHLADLPPAPSDERKSSSS